jgi:apolipoprotein N-acyltransferase
MTAAIVDRIGELARSRVALVGAAGFVLGAMSSLTFAPFSLWLLSPGIAFALLLLFCFAPPRLAARYGFLYGVGLFLSGTYWIYVSVHVFGRAPLWIALFLMFGLVLIMACYMALIGWAVARLAGRNPWRVALVGPAVWALVEWLRGWLLSGFPWLSFGYGLIDSPLAGWAPVIGIYGVSWMLLVSAAALVPLVAREGSATAAVVLALMPWVCGYALQQQDWTEPGGEAVTTTIVQGGVPQDRKWLPEQFAPTLNLYRNALLDARSSRLVVWPEVAIPAVSSQVDSYLELLQRDVAVRGQSLALGILEPHADGGQVYNSVILLDGESRQAYRKRHLVPFGEYFPVPDFVRAWMRLLSLPNTDMLAGADEQPLLETAGGVLLAAAICYEDAYGAEQLYALPEARILINVSNDAWFGDSIAPHQHLQVARMRALEAGREAVRATNNGISAFIDHRGAVVQTVPQFEFATMTRDIVPRSGLTPYAATGNWPLVSLLCLLAALPITLRRST